MVCSPYATACSGSLRGSIDDAVAPRVVRFSRQPRDRALPASLLQQPFWDFEKELAGEPVFHLAVQRTLRGRLDRDALARAVTFLGARHETLRTTFTPIAGVLHQVIAPAGPELQLHDAPDGVAAAKSRAFARARVPYNLGAAPQFRPHLDRIGSDEHLLTLEFHHVAVDMWSLGLVWRDLRERVRGVLRVGDAPRVARARLRLCRFLGVAPRGGAAPA